MSSSPKIRLIRRASLLHRRLHIEVNKHLCRLVLVILLTLVPNTLLPSLLRIASCSSHSNIHRYLPPAIRELCSSTRRLFGFNIGLHLIYSEQVRNSDHLDPRADHLSFTVRPSALHACCSVLLWATACKATMQNTLNALASRLLLIQQTTRSGLLQTDSRVARRGKALS